MQQPGLEAASCPNLGTCKQLAGDSEADSYELQHVEEGRIVRHVVSPAAAASLMLLQRGNPQNFESLGLAELQATVSELIPQVQEQLDELELAYRGHYIAPEGTEVHTYATKRPYGKYWYNKLSAHRSIFEPQREEGQVRHIHLSKADDDRCLAAEVGIERRNRLTKIRTQLTVIVAALQEIVEIAG